MKLLTHFVLAVFAGLGVGLLWSAADTIPQWLTEREAIEKSVYYEGCNEVRALGKAPLYRGDPGYGSHMDGDRDGVACEDY